MSDTVDEKQGFHAQGTDAPPYDGSDRRASKIEAKGLRTEEAGELYGDLATVEEYGYVSRGYVLESAFRTWQW